MLLLSQDHGDIPPNLMCLGKHVALSLDFHTPFCKSLSAQGALRLVAWKRVLLLTVVSRTALFLFLHTQAHGRAMVRVRLRDQKRSELVFVHSELEFVPCLYSRARAYG